MSHAYISRGARLAARKVAGEMVILSADDSSLYVLNSTATAIWEAADGRTPLATIVEDIICRCYDVDRETALQDVCQLVDDLVAHGVMQSSAEAILSDVETSGDSAGAV